MRFWIRWAAALYPARWRKRYAVEFSALLDGVQPGWRDLLDILRGAILMHVKMPNVRILAAAALAGLAVSAVIAFRMPASGFPPP